MIRIFLHNHSKLLLSVETVRSSHYGRPNPAQKNCMGFGSLVPNVSETTFFLLLVGAAAVFFVANRLNLLGLGDNRKKRAWAGQYSAPFTEKGII